VIGTNGVDGGSLADAEDPLAAKNTDLTTAATAEAAELPGVAISRHIWAIDTSWPSIHLGHR
jgi:hypothetical protein